MTAGRLTTSIGEAPAVSFSSYFQTKPSATHLTDKVTC